jgi:phosphatidylserine/phosphatidylglycerophosphate/cardiolipin synthase-like enzyme
MKASRLVLSNLMLGTFLSINVQAQVLKPNAAGITFDMMHTIQKCVPVTGHQPTFCSGNTDIAPSAQASGLEDHIVSLMNKALANPEKSRVYAAEFSFSDKAMQKKMCELGHAGAKVEVYVDYGSADNISFTKDPSCQKDPAHPNLKGVLLGGFTNFPDWRLHHNKTVVVDAGDGSNYDIAFSSGNLSVFGVSLHMDHWVFMSAPAKSNIAKASVCLFQGLEAADQSATSSGMYASAPDFTKDPTVMAAYQNAREACYKTNGVIPMSQPEAAVAKEGVAPFFTPNDGQYAFQTLKTEINKVTQQAKSGPAFLYIAIEHFSSTAIANVVNQAANAGVDVRIIMNSGTVSGASEVASDAPFYQQNLKNGKIKVRFIETNPAAGGNGQQMHNKFAILNGKRVFSGAGHYTSSGLNTNFETLYLTQDANLTKKYVQYFKELWNESVDESYLVNHTPNTTPAPLSQQAENLLK